MKNYQQDTQSRVPFLVSSPPGFMPGFMPVVPGFDNYLP